MFLILSSRYKVVFVDEAEGQSHIDSVAPISQAVLLKLFLDGHYPRNNIE